MPADRTICARPSRRLGPSFPRKGRKMRTIKSIVRSASIEAGHAIQVDLEFADTTRESLRCGAHVAPNLVQALIQAGATAAKQRSAAPHQSFDVVDPYRATDCRTAAAHDGRLVLEYSTQSVVPVQIAMTPSLARKTIEQLEAALTTLERQPPDRKN